MIEASRPVEFLLFCSSSAGREVLSDDDSHGEKIVEVEVLLYAENDLKVEGIFFFSALLSLGYSFRKIGVRMNLNHDMRNPRRRKIRNGAIHL